MQVRLTFADSGTEEGGPVVDSADCARSLHRWLLADPELRGLAEITGMPAQPPQGHMGEALEVINVVLSNAVALSSLLVTVAAWRGSRARPPEVRIERGGVTVTVQGASPDVVEQILRASDAGDSSSVRDRRHGATE